MLTHQLYEGTTSEKPRTTVTRGQEVRLAVDYDNPWYAPAVFGGFVTNKGVYVPARNAPESARDETLHMLEDRLESMFDGLDLTQSPELVSSVLRTGS